MEFLEENENLLLNLYKESLKSIQSLEEERGSVVSNPNLKVHKIREALANVDHLINLEMQNIFPVCQLETPKILVAMRAHLTSWEQQYTKPPDLLPKPNETLKVHSVSKKPKDQTKINKDEIAQLQVKPRVKGLQDIAGLVDAKKVLATIVIVPLYQPQLFEGRKICNSLLLYGPPGTGKTVLVHALAAEISANLFAISSSNILSPFVGQTEKMLQSLFETIKEPRKGSTILFIDEIDGICRSRNTNEAEWSRRLKTELMCQLSNIEDMPNVFLICATNCPWDLDAAFLRRFQRRLYIPLPNGPDRFALFQLLVQNNGLEVSSTSWGALLSRTEGYSGSDLTDLIRNAINIPITELFNTKQWKPVDNNKFQPANENDLFSESVKCNFLDLPQGSVIARKPHIGDIMATLDIVRPTVSDADVKRYENFMKNA